jgi:hypothetical protein
MDYEKNLHYLRSASSDQITEAAVSGKPRSGLGSRAIDREPLEVEEPDLQNKYMGLLKGMRPEKTEVEDLADLGPTDEEMAETSDEVTSMVRPKGRSQVSKGETQEAVYQGLLKRDFPEHVAQGIMMNFQDESGFKADIVEAEPNVHGTRGKGYYQLTGDRREAFEERYGDDWSTDNQLDFLLWELDNTEKSARKKLFNTKTAGEAGAAFVTNFLRPAEKHRKERVARYANSVGYVPMTQEG